MFAGAGIESRIVALFGIETAAHAALSLLQGIPLPQTIRALTYPSIDSARNYPTIGPGAFASGRRPSRRDPLIEELQSLRPVAHLSRALDGAGYAARDPVYLGCDEVVLLKRDCRLDSSFSGPGGVVPSRGEGRSGRETSSGVIPHELSCARAHTPPRKRAGAG